MDGLSFEWNPVKNRGNQKTHGLRDCAQTHRKINIKWAA